MLFVYQLTAMVIIFLGSYFFSFPFSSFDDDRTIKFFIKLRHVTIACLTNQWSKHLQRTESIKFIKASSWMYDEESFCSNFLIYGFCRCIFFEEWCLLLFLVWCGNEFFISMQWILNIYCNKYISRGLFRVWSLVNDISNLLLYSHSP